MLRKITLIFVAFSLLLGFAIFQPNAVRAANETVSVWLSTADQSNRLTQKTSINFAPNSGTNPITINVNPAVRYQQMDGYGASFTDSSAWLVWNRLSAATRTTLMNELFSKSSGIGLSMLRQPLGASDFSSRGNYSYDDTCCDLSNFSINVDSAYIIPVVQQAKSINSSIKIIGSPWSAPGWMKTSGSMVGGSLNHATQSDNFAQYFVRYIQQYQAQGIPIYAITVQNEPLFIPPGYPGMGMSAGDQAGFIGFNLGPALRNAGLNTKIMVYDHNWDQANYPLTVFGNATANQYVAGVGWHCYGGNVSSQNDVHNQYPNKDAWITECSGGNWAPYFNDWAANLKGMTHNLIILAARYWAKGTILWNMALDTNNGPTNGGCTTCRGVVTINQSNGTYTKTVDYYILGHASKFVDAGAYRIDSNTHGANSIENVAFQNPDGSLVVLAVNNVSSSQTFKVIWSGQAFSYTLPAGAVVTFKWSPGSGTPPTNTPVPSGNGSPYNGTPAAIPGTVQIENFNTGGQGVAYSDAEATNQGGQYRTGDGVDIEATTDTGGGFDVGWTSTGEWLKYTVNVQTSGTYNLNFRVASAQAGGTFHLEVDGANVTGTMTVPNTGGWQTWQTVTRTGVSLSAGQRVMRLVMDTTGGNFNWFSVTSGGTAPTNTPAPNPTRTNTPPPSGGINQSVYYQIVNQNSNKCLDNKDGTTTNGTWVQQWACFTGSSNQSWRFTATDSGYYRISSRTAPTLAIDVSGGTTATGDGAKVHLWTYGGATNQQWLAQDMGGGNYRFIARHSNKCLDVPGSSTTDGIQLQQYTCNNSAAQNFRLVQQP